MKQEKIYIYGKHAVMEAIKNSPKTVKKVFLAKEDDKELMSLIDKTKIPHSQLGHGEGVENLEKDAKHQGVIGLISLDRLLLTYDEFMKDFVVTPDTAFVVMGELQDPQNVGAVIRSSAALGISAVFIPEFNQAPVTGSVVKVSAGMAFRIPLIKIGNINNVLRDLKKKGFWIYGLEGTAKESLDEQKFEEPTVFVLGNESKGIREKTSELCDIMLRIPMNPRCESMNVASSTAIALYAWSTKHPKSLK